MQIVIELAKQTCNGIPDWLIVAKDKEHRMVLESFKTRKEADKRLKYWESLAEELEEWRNDESKRISPATVGNKRKN